MKKIIRLELWTNTLKNSATLYGYKRTGSCFNLNFGELSEMRRWSNKLAEFSGCPIVEVPVKNPQTESVI